MPYAGSDPFERALHTARGWVADVAAELGTDDLGVAYRVSRAWLHVVRDRLPVNDAANLGAQLPELLRGVYYEGWQPSAVPVKYDRNAFVTRFADQARIAKPDVPKAAHAVSTAFATHLSGHLSGVLERYPEQLRDLLRPG